MMVECLASKGQVYPFGLRLGGFVEEKAERM